MDTIYDSIEQLRAAAESIYGAPTVSVGLEDCKLTVVAAIHDAEAARAVLCAEGLEPEDFESYSAERAQAHATAGARKALGVAMGSAREAVFAARDAVALERIMHRIATQLRWQAVAEQVLHDSVLRRRSVA